MFDSDIEKTIIVTALILWFATAWYLNERLKYVHSKLDLLLDQFNGLREYLYEIDPQFDEERRLSEEFEQSYSEDNVGLSGFLEMDYLRKRKAEGKRTLDTGFNSDKPE